MTLKQYKFLKLLSRYDMSASELEKHFGDFANDQELADPAFHSFFYRRDDRFCINAEGIKIFQQKREENFRFLIPVVISVIALVLSIISICLQYL